MNPSIRKTIVMIFTAITGSVFYLLWGWFIFDFLLGKYMEANTTSLPGFKKNESEGSVLMLYLSCLAYSALLTLIFGVLAGIKNFWKGCWSGMVIGILIAIMTDLYWYSTSHFFNSITPALVDVIAAGITVGPMGGIVAAMLGKTGK